MSTLASNVQLMSAVGGCRAGTDTLALERSSFDAPSCAWRAFRAPTQTKSHDTQHTIMTERVELWAYVRATCLPRPERAA